MGRYGRILRRRAVAWPFAAAVTARLPISMGPLGIVVLVQQVRGRYATAGLVTAAFAFGAAVGAPVWGQLLDRRGQSRVIGPLAVASSLFLAVLALLATTSAPDGALVAVAAAVGVCFPPISPAMRGAWRVVLETEDERRAAYALDAVAVETIFVGGPLLLSVLLGHGPASLPLLVTAVLLLVGGLGYATTGAARAWRPEHPDGGGTPRGASPVRDPGVVQVLLVAVTIAVGFGLSDLSVAATARQVLGNTKDVGWLFAALAGGSAVGGLWYGSRTWPGPEHRRLPAVLGGFATGLLVTGTLLWSGHGSSLPVLLVVLFVTGLCIAPGLIVLANLVDRHGAVDRLGEAQAWLNTAFTAGGALGTAVAGLAVDAGGPAAGFTVAAVAVATAMLVSVVGGRHWPLPDAPPTPPGS